MSEQTCEFDLRKEDLPRFLQDLNAVTGGENIVITSERGARLHVQVMWALKEPPASLKQYLSPQEKSDVSSPRSGSVDRELDF